MMDITETDKSIYIKTLGCKVNAYDSHALESQFKKQGFKLADSAAQADITLINTCSVTAKAEKEARHLLRRFSKENPSAKRIVTGCYAQIESGTIQQLDEVDYIVPNEVKDKLVPLIEKELQSPNSEFKDKLPIGQTAVIDNKQGHFKSSLTLFDSPSSERTRTFLKIQDGCNGFCSYCQIPYARGASRSVDPQQVLEQISKLADKGVGEIVFTGIHIGDYGEDLKHSSLSFAQLLEKVVLIPGINRLRISSLEPAELTPELMTTIEKNKHIFCDHFHLPLQSGSSTILKKMRRQYTLDRYRQSVDMIRQVFPKAHISCDIIPGFPGETREHFAESVQFIKECAFSSLHVFPYSKRPNTSALRMPGHLEIQEIRERAKVLRNLGDELSHNFIQNQIGQEAKVLWEKNKDKKGRSLGKTRNYIKVASPTPQYANTETTVTLKGFVDKQTLLGS